MRFSHALLALAIGVNADVSIIDSRTHPGKSWIMVNDCAVEVDTADFKNNQDIIMKKVNAFCDYDYLGYIDHAQEK